MLVSGPWNSFQDTRSGTLPLTQCLSPYVCYVLAFEICGMHQMCHKPRFGGCEGMIYNGAARRLRPLIQMLSRLSHSLNHQVEHEHESRYFIGHDHVFLADKNY